LRLGALALPIGFPDKVFSLMITSRFLTIKAEAVALALNPGNPGNREAKNRFGHE
jgi:hypothetical protein